MGILLWLVIGGVIGWLASILMGTEGRQGLILNVLVGIVGAALGGWLFGGGPTINQGNLSANSVVVSLIGAVLFIGILKLIRRV